MKEFLEAMDITEASGAIRENFKEEVTTTEEVAKNKLIEKFKGGHSYKMKKHICYHDEKINKPCVFTDYGSS